MVQTPVSRGRCLLCGDSRLRKSQMIQHLAGCSRWEAGPQRFVMLLFEGRPAARHWFVLAVDVGASLRDVDQFLRVSTLGPPPIEKAGSFRPLYGRRGPRAAPAEAASSPQNVDFDARLETLIEPGFRLWYDAATDLPPLAMRVLVERKGVSPQGRVRLLARNE